MRLWVTLETDLASAEDEWGDVTGRFAQRHVDGEDDVDLGGSAAGARQLQPEGLHPRRNQSGGADVQLRRQQRLRVRYVHFHRIRQLQYQNVN